MLCHFSTIDRDGVNTSHDIVGVFHMALRVEVAGRFREEKDGRPGEEYEDNLESEG